MAAMPTACEVAMIRVLLFGAVAERAGRREMRLDAADAGCVRDVVRLAGCAGMQPLLVAVNQEIVSDMNGPVNDGDEVALMPPFSGG